MSAGSSSSRIEVAGKIRSPFDGTNYRGSFDYVPFFLRVCLIFCSFSLFGQLQAESEKSPWGDNFDLAKSRASKSKKDVLLVFTVREWSAICRTFEEQFLKQEEFTKALMPMFEIVHLDASQEETAGEEEAKTFQLRKHFDITTFPAVILTDSQGMPYAFSGYRSRGGLESYVEHLKKLRQLQINRVQMLKKARNTNVLKDKITRFAEALPVLGRQRRAKFYGDLLREIIALDPVNSHGFTHEFEMELAEFEYVKSLRALEAELEWTKMIEMIDGFLANSKLTNKQRQSALMDRFDVERQMSDPKAILRTLAQVVAVNSHSPHGRHANQLLQSINDELQFQRTLRWRPEN